MRYKRPLSSIVVTLQHGSCMCFGGSFDPAYVMSVFALPCELQPATNRRNAAVIQRHMHESLGVLPSRGLLRFVSTPEENMATNGKTIAGEMDDLANPKDGGKTTAAGDESNDTAASRRSKSTRRLSVKVREQGCHAMDPRNKWHTEKRHMAHTSLSRLEPYGIGVLRTSQPRQRAPAKMCRRGRHCPPSPRRRSRTRRSWRRPVRRRRGAPRASWPPYL